MHIEKDKGENEIAEIGRLLELKGFYCIKCERSSDFHFWNIFVIFLPGLLYISRLV